MRKPSATLVVDAAVQIAAVRGKRTKALRLVLGNCVLVTTSRAVEEAAKVIEFKLGRRDLLGAFGQLGAVIDVVDVQELQQSIVLAREFLQYAVNSRNGLTSDDHILALAWRAEADIWSPGRDFAGTGVANWSTPNLVRALA
ncbi:MAG TPA: hypothetical protein DCL54_12880 [Alphaproteobacteria bacterium]|nr:hypothetical protein [Alphaproteobacteria bacterium]HAJ47464.1 hypothetical protein [Alphaproteobacteria bacterium]